MADQLNTQIANAQFNTMQASLLARNSGRDDVAEKLQVASAKLASAITLYMKKLAENPPAPKPAYQHPGHTLTPAQTITSIAENAGLTPADLVAAVQNCLVNVGLTKAMQGTAKEQVQFLHDILGGQKTSQFIFKAMELDKHFPHPQHHVNDLVKFMDYAISQEWCKEFDLGASIENLIKDPKTDLHMNKHIRYQIDFLMKHYETDIVQKIVEDAIAKKNAPLQPTVTAPTPPEGHILAAGQTVTLTEAGTLVENKPAIGPVEAPGFNTVAGLTIDHSTPDEDAPVQKVAADTNVAAPKKAMKNPILMATPVVIDLQNALKTDNSEN